MATGDGGWDIVECKSCGKVHRPVRSEKGLVADRRQGCVTFSTWHCWEPDSLRCRWCRTLRRIKYGERCEVCGERHTRESLDTTWATLRPFVLGTPHPAFDVDVPDVIEGAARFYYRASHRAFDGYSPAWPEDEA